jgi:uncharacterized lipoprotein
VNFIKLAAVTVVLSFTTACVSFFDEQKNEQTDRKSALVLPEGFSDPKKSKEYDLPVVESSADTDGEMTSPTTVLVIFDGSWLDEQDTHPAKIKVEKPELVENFANFIDEGIQSFAEQNNLTLTKNANGYLVEQLIVEDDGYWFIEDLVEVERFSYNVVVNLNEQGRSGDVAIDMLDYQKISQDLAPNHAVRYRKEALAAETLNNLMLELDYIYRVKLLKERASLDITLALVKNVSGNYVIRSQQDIKYVWSQVDDIIEELGFDIEESDKDLHIFDVVYNKASDSIWHRLFSSDYSGKLDIEPGEYEVALTTSTTGVNISFRSKKGTFLDQASMEQLFQLMLEVVKDEEAEL